MRFKHPSLAAIVSADDGRYINYRVPSSREELEEWIEETFSVSDPVSAEEVIRMLRPGPYATLYYVASSGEVLLHTAHWRTDGLGAVMLLDSLLSFAAQRDLPDPWSLAWGEETQRLAPAVEEAANMPETPSAQQAKLAQDAVGTFALAVGAVGIPYYRDDNSYKYNYKPATTIPAGTRAASIQLSPTTTSAIIQACKTKGISVTSAIHASIASANWSLAATQYRDRPYTSTARFNLRPYLQDPYSTSAYAHGLYTTGWMVQVGANTTWTDRARTYNQIYRRGLSPDYVAGHREYARLVCDLIRNLSTRQEPPSDVDISSIGVVDDRIRSIYGDSEYGIDVKAISVGVDLITPQATAFVWTFRERLNVHVIYNESYHAPEQMDEFVKIVKDVLLKELDVGSEESGHDITE